MKDKCILLGLNVPIVDVKYVLELQATTHDLIVLNDWYFHFPVIKKPDMIFNIHMMDDYSMFYNEGRWVDWENHYNETDATIVVKRIYPKLRTDDKIIFYPIDEMIQAVSKNVFTCQMTYMMAYLTIVCRYKEIFMTGLQGIGNSAEYRYQIPAILYLSDLLRKKYNVSIINPQETDWKVFMDSIGISYTSLPELEKIYE